MEIGVIGSGFSGLSAAAYLAKAGHKVCVYEKHSTPGGRARQLITSNGYKFDMGPSWYWMPDILESFFNDFNTTARDHYELVTLDPQFEMVFADGSWSIPSGQDELCIFFESIEKGAGEKFRMFMRDAKEKYDVSMHDFIEKPCHSWWEFVSPQSLRSAFRLNLFSTFDQYVRRFFRDPRLIALMEFPVLFLGAAPHQIPAMYSLMHHGGLGMGTHYPMGGFYEVIRAMVAIAKDQGVKFHFNHDVVKIHINGHSAIGLSTDTKYYPLDAILASGDYHHIETKLLDAPYRNYQQPYWDQRVMAPSCLIYYLGFNRRIPNLKHHTLFFEHDLRQHTADIYETRQWPRQPLFYACCPSKTDTTIAPAGHENLFLLVPIATSLEDSEEIREMYFGDMMSRLARHTGDAHLPEAIDFKQSYCVRDFVNDYHALKGNAYGLANTLHQTAVLKPSIRNRHVSNLFYAGQLTVPGPGVPPSIISGKIAARELLKKNSRHEKFV